MYTFRKVTAVVQKSKVKCEKDIQTDISKFKNDL